MGKQNAVTTRSSSAVKNGRKSGPGVSSAASSSVTPNGVKAEMKENGFSNGNASYGDTTMPRKKGESISSSVTQDSVLKRLWERTVVPLFLMATTPISVFLLWFCAVHCDGSFALLGKMFSERGVFGGLLYVWGHVHWPSSPVVLLVLLYSVWALALMRLLPGPTVYGPLTPKGNRPTYTDNGFACFCVTMVTFWLLTWLCKTRLSVSPTLLYDRFDEVLLLLNLFSLLFCLLLYVKGLLAPSTSDAGSSGNVIFDYYWGTELYPRILGFDVKVFTNCRFGMTVWPLLVCIFALKSYELHGLVDSMLVSAVLQMVYFAKFFWWEAGYMCTIDIMVDRAGYYICWGCLVFIPGLYASVSLSLVNQPVHLGLPLSALILVLGVLCIYVNYDADRQKLEVRGTQGQCLVWGRKPVILRARYKLDSGETKESILLASGWWGLARHFHYVAEIALTLCWSVPALFSGGLLPYTYCFWLLLLLTHRSYRDDEKCGKKYGQFWMQYCQLVPYRIVPYIF